MLFNEPKLLNFRVRSGLDVNIRCFSALQRAEIAETDDHFNQNQTTGVSVLFNEPKLLTFGLPYERVIAQSFSALQRAEIAEADPALNPQNRTVEFQCSSTSRNC